MWCVGKLDEEYIAKMEDMLKIYERPPIEKRTGGLRRRKGRWFCIKIPGL
jgi:hypothetical protein